MNKIISYKPITQEDPFGCGVACTAFLLDQSYKETIKMFNIKKIENYGCDCPDISKVLNKNGLAYKWKKYTTGLIPNFSVVYLGPNDYYQVGHWLVKYNDTWMNPWVSGKTIKEAEAGMVNNLLGKITYIVYPYNKE